MRGFPDLINVFVGIAFIGGILYCFFRFAKSLFLPKSRVHIAIGVMIIGLALAAIGAGTRDRDTVQFGVLFIILGLFAAAISVFTAKILAEKYQPYLRRGKSANAEQLMEKLKKKDVDTVLFELSCLFDRGYLPGFTINMESHAIIPAAMKNTAQELGKTVNKTISAFKNVTPEAASSICKRCGAPVPETGAVNCEFCGSSIPR